MSNKIRTLKHLWKLYLLLFLITACQETTQDCLIADHKALSFSIKKSYSIPVDSQQYAFDAYFPIVEKEDSTILASYDPVNHEINFFWLEGRKRVATTKLLHDDYNAVEDPYAFFYHNKDSIFISRGGYFSLYLINNKGEKINEWDFTETYLPDSLMKNNEIHPTYSLGAIDKYGVHFKYQVATKELIAHLHVVPKDQDNTFPYTYRSPVVARFNITTGQLNKVIAPFPDMYLNDRIPHDMFFPFELFNGKIVLTFPSSHQVLIEDHPQSFACLPSTFMKTDQIKLYDKNNGGTIDEFWQGLTTNPSYSNIVSDPYRNLLYRIVKHDIEYKDANGKVNNSLQATWSLMVIDSDFQVLGEIKFDEVKYNFLHVYALPQGVLISKNNVHSDEFQEDILEFDLLKIEYE